MNANILLYNRSNRNIKKGIGKNNLPNFDLWTQSNEVL